MNYQAALQNLVGKAVAVDDQTRAAPRMFVGILVDEKDGDYTVVDNDDGVETGFNFSHVVSVQGDNITLEAPEPFNSGWDDSDESRPEDDDAYDADGEMDGFTF